MGKKNNIILVCIGVVTVITLAFLLGGGQSGQGGQGNSYTAGYNQGYADVKQDPRPGGGNSALVSRVIREHEGGLTIGKLTPRDDDPEYVSGYKAGMRAAAKELDSR